MEIRRRKLKSIKWRRTTKGGKKIAKTTLDAIFE
jgi:hypothetical protein